MVSLRDVVAGFREVFSRDPEVVVSSPGRIDLLNTHQDYKGLPVVGIGISLRTYVALGRALGDRSVAVSRNLRDAGERYVDSFVHRDVEVSRERFFGNYVRASVVSLRIRGLETGPFYAYIDSDVPMGSGLGSSGALLVSLVHGLSVLFGLGLSLQEVGETAYMAEHDVMGIPCGRLDQYTSVFGGVLRIETRPPYRVEKIGLERGFFIVIDTGIRHSTAEIHPRRQGEIDYGLEMLRNIVPERIRSLLGTRYYNTCWECLDASELAPYLALVPYPYSNRILYTLEAHRSTEDILEVLRGGAGPEKVYYVREEIERFLGRRVSIERDPLHLLGAVMTYQHVLLSRLYDVSLPVIDDLVRRLVGLGALGAKLSGAGLGGSVVALAGSRRDAERILSSVLREGLAPRGWVVEVDEGVRTEYVQRV